MKLLGAFFVLCAASCTAQQPSDSSCGVYEENADAIEVTTSEPLSIGTTPSDGADGFAALGDLGKLELVLGTQGGWMATPSLRLDAASMAIREDSCIWVSIEVDIEGMQEPISILDAPRFRFENGVAYSESLNVLLSFDITALEGKNATFTAEAQAGQMSARTSVQTLLVNEK